MHIVHVTHRAWPVVGGSERYVQAVARQQVLAGHRVTIIATDADELAALWERRGRRVAADAPGEHEGVRIRRLPVRPLPLGALTFPAVRWLMWTVEVVIGWATPLRFRSRPGDHGGGEHGGGDGGGGDGGGGEHGGGDGGGGDGRGGDGGGGDGGGGDHGGSPLREWMAGFPWVPSLAAVLEEERPDLLFAWHITLDGLSAAVARAARRMGVPWIAVPLLHLGHPRFYTMPHQLALLRRASAVLAQTPTERAFLLRCGLDAGRVHIVRPWVDWEAASRADGARFRRAHGIEGPLVVTVGALSYEKGTLHLVAAARRLWRQGRRFTLVLVGGADGRVRRALARLRGPCLWLGEVTEEEKWDAIDAADVVAQPSRSESFGIVFLEARARGKPVVAARAGAVPDVVADGVDGRLVDFGDVAGLTTALDALLDDPKRAAAPRGDEAFQSPPDCHLWLPEAARTPQR